MSSLTTSKGFDTLHRFPNACLLYRIPRECSRNLNLLVCFLDCHATDVARKDKGVELPGTASPLSLRAIGEAIQSFIVPAHPRGA